MEVWYTLCASLPVPCGPLIILCKETEKHFQEYNWREGVMSPNLVVHDAHISENILSLLGFQSNTECISFLALTAESNYAVTFLKHLILSRSCPQNWVNRYLPGRRTLHIAHENAISVYFILFIYITFPANRASHAGMGTLKDKMEYLSWVCLLNWQNHGHHPDV